MSKTHHAADEPATVTMNGVAYPVPPLPFRIASRIIPRIMARPNVGTEQGLLDIMSIVHEGLRYSSPDIAPLEDFLNGPCSIEELMNAFSTVSGQAGLRKAEVPGEAKGA